MDGAGWHPGTAPTVGVVGEPPVGPVREALDRLGTPIHGDLEEVLGSGPDCLLVGAAGLETVAEAGASTPVIPASVDRVDPDRLETILAEGVPATVSPVLAIDGPAGDRPLAVSEIALVAREPGRLSEYAVGTDAGRTRADGLVLATPVGSAGYASRLGAPQLVSGTDAVVAVPIAPYGLSDPSWVLPPDAVEITVCRNDEPVGLWVDGVDRGTVTPGDAVSARRVGSLPLAV